MSVKTRVATAAAIIGVTGALGFGLAPSAGASAAQNVTVTVTHKANYDATICVTDNLGGTCREVARGKSRSFSVQPQRGTPVNVRVVARSGGVNEVSVVTGGSSLRFETAGSKAKPSLRRR
ncbi:hypothetical protein [Streptosporangium sp. NPDC004631]